MLSILIPVPGRVLEEERCQIVYPSSFAAATRHSRFGISHMNHSEVASNLAESVSAITDPEIGRSLGELKMVGGVRIDDGVVHVEIDLPTPAYPGRERIAQAVRSLLSEQSPASESVNVSFSSSVRGHESGGSIGLSVRNIIAVGSGKGGVGKSTVAACMAYGLNSFGARVGLMDADVYGPSIPHMLNVTGQPAATEKQTADGQSVMRIMPHEVNGIRMMSMGFFVEPHKAIVWRGPMLHKALTQFLKDTDWGDLDYLVIDLPPGTGDVSLTLAQLVGLAGAVVVCTPQQVALLDAVRAIDMYRTVKVPVLGIVENMSGEVFGRGGAKSKAAELGVPFLGEIPIEAAIRIKTDEGSIPDLFAADNPARGPLLHVCQQTAIQIARQLLETPQLPTLEIL